jgi:hypothetical protein
MTEKTDNLQMKMISQSHEHQCSELVAPSGLRQKSLDFNSKVSFFGRSRF